jgi:hypothetical protein
MIRLDHYFHKQYIMELIKESSAQSIQSAL